MFTRAEEGYSLKKFNVIGASYKNVGLKGMKNSLFSFLSEIIPAAEQRGVLKCIHLDGSSFSYV